MIQTFPLAELECSECHEVVVVYGDDDLLPDEPEAYVCVWCLDPRQREHDEFVAAERGLA